jgi:hypothetical protein
MPRSSNRENSLLLPSPEPFAIRGQTGMPNGLLKQNLRMLQTHLNAVGEITAIIARAIQDHESDGTYSIENNGQGRYR